MTAPLVRSLSSPSSASAQRLSAVVARAHPSERREPRSDPTPAPVLIMAGVHKSLSAGVPGCSAVARVLVGVSLRVAAGEVVGIAGAAGAGKSTLLLCAAGIVRPEVGSLSWPGEGEARALPAPTRAVRAAPVYLPMRGAFPLREVELALSLGARLVILDHSAPAPLHGLPGSIGQSLRRHTAALIVASRSRTELARVASRVLELRDGCLHAAGRCAASPAGQRKRSAARVSSELPSALARSRIRSTCGRSFRSPQ